MEEENFEPTLTASSGTSDEGWMAAENVEIAGTEKPELLTPPHSEALEKKNTVYEKIARWCAVAAIFLAPLFFLPWTTGILELNKQAFLTVITGAGLVFWFLHVIISGQMAIRRSSVDWGVLAFFGSVTLATIFSLTRFKSLFGLSTSLSDSLLAVGNLTILYFLTVNLFGKGAKLKLILSASIWLALLFGLLQMLGLYIFKYLNISILGFTFSRVFNTVGSLNTLGMVAALSLPLFSRGRMDKGRLRKYMNISGTAIAFAVLFILNWWVLWAAAVAGMVAIIIFDSLRTAELKSLNVSKLQSFRISKFLFPMTVIVLAVFLTIVGLNLSVIKKNFPVEVGPSFSLSGNVTKSVLSESPILGYGPENFSLAFDQFGAGKLAGSSLSGLKFFDATAQVINFAVHGGAVMVLGFLFLLWMILLTIKKGLAAGGKDYTGTATAFSGAPPTAVVAALVAVTVAMFIYPANLTLSFFFYALLALLVLSSGGEKKLYDIEEKAVVSLVSSLGFVGTLILVLVELYFGATLYVADIKYAKALGEKDVSKQVDFLAQAINLNGNDDRYYRSASQAALNLLAKELNAKVDKNDTQQGARIQNYMSSAINLAKRATEIAPRETNNWANLGSVYQGLIGLVGGVDELSGTAYAKAAELRPGDANIYNAIGNVFLGKADLLFRLAASGSANAQQLRSEAGSALQKAEENYKKATEISNNFGLAIYNLGVVYDRQGKLNEAIKQLEKIVPFNSNQPNLAFELGLLYYRNNQKNKAFDQLQRAILLSPNFSNARWYLALLFEERKDLPSAIEQLEKIMDLPENKDNQVVSGKLNELKSGRTTIPPQKVLDQKPLQ
ncbi:MAG: hypothetical protein UU83_C0052G0001 [Candidatus Jorgensenbacteria bacterium GW2011_GWF2_41_8]|nr:MAG: hypothetical protein UU83_C0052G0001 [Candidatus Jorgensenbacteria bacterium GW2011_GWF2_41_8]